MENTHNNILVIDSAGNDSVSYKKSDIDSCLYNYRPDFKEFLDIITDDIENIYSIDSRNCIAIIDSGDNEVSLNKYKPNVDIRFFKLSDPVLKKGNAEFYINTDLLYGKKSFNRQEWSELYLYTLEDKLPDYPDDRSDWKRQQKLAAMQFDGYSICNDLLNKYTDIKKPYAVKYCNDINIDNSGMQYHGFLPSVYQLGVMLFYMTVIEKFNKIYDINEKINEIFYESECSLWSCNEWWKEEVWQLGGLYRDIEMNFGENCYTGYKHYPGYVFPVFKKIQNF